MKASVSEEQIFDDDWAADIEEYHKSKSKKD